MNCRWIGWIPSQPAGKKQILLVLILDHPLVILVSWQETQLRHLHTHHTSATRPLKFKSYLNCPQKVYHPGSPIPLISEYQFKYHGLFLILCPKTTELKFPEKGKPKTSINMTMSKSLTSLMFSWVFTSQNQLKKRHSFLKLQLLQKFLGTKTTLR